MKCGNCIYEGRGTPRIYIQGTRGEHWQCPACKKLTKKIKTKTKTLHQVLKMTEEQAKELFKDDDSDFIVHKLYAYFTEPYTKTQL